jgi:hypothetical protein
MDVETLIMHGFVECDKILDTILTLSGISKSIKKSPFESFQQRKRFDV